MAKPATRDQQKAIDKIKANGGEAIRCGPYYRAGGWTVCDRRMMELMARKGLVRLEQVGASSFALPQI